MRLTRHGFVYHFPYIESAGILHKQALQCDWFRPRAASRLPLPRLGRHSVVSSITKTLALATQPTRQFE